MGKLHLNYVSSDIDRHGNVRFYFRKHGSPKVRLRGDLAVLNFSEAYQSALDGQSFERKKSNKLPAGSFSEICLHHFSNAYFLRLDPMTQAWQRRHLEAIEQRFGRFPIKAFEPRHIRV